MTQYRRRHRVRITGELSDHGLALPLLILPAALQSFGKAFARCYSHGPCPPSPIPSPSRGKVGNGTPQTPALVPQGLGAVPPVPELELLLCGKSLSAFFGLVVPSVPERSNSNGNVCSGKKAFHASSTRKSVFWWVILTSLAWLVPRRLGRPKRPCEPPPSPCR